MKAVLSGVTVDKQILEFFERKVKEEKAKGYGATRSAMVETALKEYLFKRYGFQYVAKTRRGKA